MTLPTQDSIRPGAGGAITTPSHLEAGGLLADNVVAKQQHAKRKHHTHTSGSDPSAVCIPSWRGKKPSTENSPPSVGAATAGGRES